MDSNYEINMRFKLSKNDVLIVATYILLIKAIKKSLVSTPINDKLAKIITKKDISNANGMVNFQLARNRILYS